MYKFKIVKLKNFILPFILVFFTICLVVFSNSNLKAAKNGLVLWANSVVPSLFPFFVATELLSYTNFTYYLGKLLNKFITISNYVGNYFENIKAGNERVVRARLEDAVFFVRPH